jgi:hypothetical protein
LITVPLQSAWILKTIEKIWPISMRIALKTKWLVESVTSTLELSFSTQFTKKHRAYVDTKKWRSGLTRLDRPSQSPQKVIWASPLDRSRRVDQDSYIERPIRSPDERDMAFGRSPRHRGGRPRGLGGLTRYGHCKPSQSCILARDLLGFQLRQGQDLPTL